jgi:hypothetical protein
MEAPDVQRPPQNASLMESTDGKPPVFLQRQSREYYHVGIFWDLENCWYFPRPSISSLTQDRALFPLLLLLFLITYICFFFFLFISVQFQ